MYNNMCIMCKYRKYMDNDEYESKHTPLRSSLPNTHTFVKLVSNLFHTLVCNIYR